MYFHECKLLQFWFKFHWILSLRVHFTKSQHWFSNCLWPHGRQAITQSNVDKMSDNIRHITRTHWLNNFASYIHVLTKAIYIHKYMSYSLWLLFHSLTMLQYVSMGKGNKKIIYWSIISVYYNCIFHAADVFVGGRAIWELLNFPHCIRVVSFNVWVRYLCGIPKVPFEIPYKIPYPNIERCEICREVSSED